MKKFNDNKNRAWTIDINLDVAERLLEIADVNVWSLFEGGGDLPNYRAFIGNPVAQAKALVVCVQEQIEAAKITPSDFKRAFGPEHASAARQAFLDEALDFFHHPQQRELIRELLRKADALTMTLMPMAMEELNKLDVNAEANKLRETIRQRNAKESASPTNSPEPSESIPAS